MAKTAKKNGHIPQYRTYLFKDKDPIIDKVRTVVQDSNESYKAIHDSSGVSTTTLYNWFHGATKRPQFCTVAAVIRALGKDIGIVSRR